MIELERHIEILLLSNDCVIVPDLGGFMAHHIEARYDERDSMFLPPLRTLGFNSQLKLNDSLLAQSYVEAYDISYPEAVRRIEDEVNELKQHLRNNGLYELNDIGTIFLNENGNYSFEPCEAGILTPELYGLSSFEMKRNEPEANTDKLQAAGARKKEPAGMRDADTRKKTSKKTASATGQTGMSLSESETTIPLEAASGGYNNNDNFIKIKVAWVRNAVAVAAAIIAFFVISTPISNSTYNGRYVSTMPNQMLLGMTVENNAKPKNIELAPEQIKDIKKIVYADSATAQKAASTKSSKDSIKVTATAKSTIKYCIVMASRVTKSNADSFVRELHGNGYSQAYTYINNNVVRVAYGNYENEEEAYAALRDVRGNKYFEQAWVYKKK